MNRIILCKDGCQNEAVRDSKGKSKGRCAACHTKYKRLMMAASRKALKLKQLAAGADINGSKVCTKCLRLKRTSEYSTRRKDGTGVANKICDTCLTAVYMSAARRSVGFDEGWWRRRAYTCNSAYRALLAHQRGVAVRSIKTPDLDYICKPQDIADLYAKQDGKCYYCAEPLAPDNTSIDHATPLCRGGEHHPRNFRVSCGDCNHLKYKRNEKEFRDFLRSYVIRFK